MIPETVDSSQGFYVLGTIILVIGALALAGSLLIKRRLEEEHRDERYVRERRGEEIEPTDPPRIASLLQYIGLGIAAIGIMVLVAGWTLAPGQS